MNKNLHLIFGADDYFVDLKAKKLLEQFEGIPLEIIDGSMHSIADLKRILGQVSESLRTMDFFSDKKCVWLRSTSLLSNGSPAFTEGGQIYVESCLDLLKKLPEEVQFFISASPVDKRTRLFKTLQDLCQCEELEEKNSKDYLKFLVQKLSKQLSIGIEAAAFELLQQKLNYQPRAIANEFEKLACLKNFSGTISYEDVLKYTPTMPNDEFFEPIEAFYNKDKQRYLQSLRDHFTIHKEVRSILSMLQNRNRLLLQLASLQLQSVSKNSLDAAYQRYQQDFGPIQDKNTFCVFSQNPWYLSRLKNLFTLEILVQIQEECVRLFDLILKHPQQACFWMESLVKFF